MKIEILGTGCAKCDKLEEVTRNAVRDLKLDAEVVKVKEIKDIMAYGVMATPALVIDGVVQSSGKIPSGDDIKKWLEKK